MMSLTLRCDSIVPVYNRTAPTQRVLTQISIVTIVNILSCDPAVLISLHLSQRSNSTVFIVFFYYIHFVNLEWHFINVSALS